VSSLSRDETLADFLTRQRLPHSYLNQARDSFDPLAAALAGKHCSGKPLLVGVNGCQGSGKSTLCEYLKLVLGLDYGLHSAVLSIDDVYHTHASREQLARQVHPLLATRGVPGTHDLALARKTLQQLSELSAGCTTKIPRFDKGSDDRLPQDRWDEITGPVDVIIIEGWCLGIPAQDEAELASPINALEQWEDADGSWRRYVNEAIARDYQPLYDSIDQWIMLRAPSFECVFNWRMEQEQKLAQGPGGNRVMDAEGIERFIQFYQRLTEHGLRVLPARVDYLLQLDEQRRISG